MPDTPNPGSDEAVKLGCTCPIVDNAHGKGYQKATERSGPVFIIRRDCLLHDHKIQEKTNGG